MKLVTATDVWYTQQQKTLDEIAEKLGVVAYRPSYHGAERDKNTVLFYLKEDEEHNHEVDRQPVRYSRSEAKDRGVNVNSECVYRDHFWSFENSDANGQLDMGWANNGKLNLRSLDWKTKLEGSITFALARKTQFDYVRGTGGFLALREADDTYNNLNREQLRALKMLTFYFATSGVYAEPVIEDHLANQICRVVWETGLTLHEREELFLDTIRDDTLPEHIMSAKDCAYIFDVCAAGRVEDAREMLGRFVTAQAAK